MEGRGFTTMESSASIQPPDAGAEAPGALSNFVFDIRMHRLPPRAHMAAESRRVLPACCALVREAARELDFAGAINVEADAKAIFGLLMSSYMNVLLVAVPLGFAAQIFGWSAGLRFGLVSAGARTTALEIGFAILYRCAHSFSSSQCNLPRCTEDTCPVMPCAADVCSTFWRW